MAWTDEMVEELKRLWDEGVTTGEIGRRLNISKNSIVGKVHRLGLSGRPSPIKKKSDTNEPKPEVKKAASAKEAKPARQKPAKPQVQKQESKPAAKPVQPPAPEPKPAIVKPAPQKHAVDNEEEDIALAKSIAMPEPEKNKKEFLSLTDLDNHTCRWPIGDPKDDNFHFCGKKVRLGQTYCEEHAAIAYVKPGKK